MNTPKLRTVAAALALAVAASSAHATLFTYDFDFQFDMSGDNVGGFRNEGPGGALKGFFTIDENRQVQDFDFDFQIIQRSNRFQGAQTDNVSLDKADGDFFNTTVQPAAGGLPERTIFSFSEVIGSVQCVPQGPVGALFGLSFSAFSFTPGGNNVSFRADSRRATPVCNRFGGLGFDIRQPNTQTQISLQESGTLRSTDVGQVPLPAAGLLLVAAFGALAGLKRRKTA